MSRHERLCALIDHKHVKRRDVRSILKDSTADSLDLNAVDSRGWPPLAIAARRGHVEIVKLLLRHGASLLSCTEPGRNTAAHVAAIFEKSEVLFELQRAARRMSERIDIMNGVFNVDRMTASELRDKAESERRRTESARRFAKRNHADATALKDHEDEDDRLWHEKYMTESHMADGDDWREAVFDAHGGAKSTVDAMNDDEYAAYIRAHMQKRREASAPRAERCGGGSRVKHDDAPRRSDAEARKLTNELEAKEREQRSKKRRVERVAEFEAQWTAFLSRVGSAADGGKLRLRDIPWPGDASVYELTEADDQRGGRAALLEAQLIEHFGATSDDESSRQTLRTQLLRWHPDKFSQKFGRTLDARDADLIVARVNLIAQCLTEMLSRVGEKSNHNTATTSATPSGAPA